MHEVSLLQICLEGEAKDLADLMKVEIQQKQEVLQRTHRGQKEVPLKDLLSDWIADIEHMVHRQEENAGASIYELEVCRSGMSPSNLHRVAPAFTF